MLDRLSPLARYAPLDSHRSQSAAACRSAAEFCGECTTHTWLQRYDICVKARLVWLSQPRSRDGDCLLAQSGSTHGTTAQGSGSRSLEILPIQFVAIRRLPVNWVRAAHLQRTFSPRRRSLRDGYAFAPTHRVQRGRRGLRDGICMVPWEVCGKASAQVVRRRDHESPTMPGHDFIRDVEP